MKEKGNVQGFLRVYLKNKAQNFVDAQDWKYVINVLALFVYRFVILSNIDYFIDFTTVSVFWVVSVDKENLAPSLLADVYYSLYMSHKKKGGMILCCTLLLYLSLVSHMFKNVFMVDE